MSPSAKGTRHVSDSSNRFQPPSLDRITSPIIGGTEQKDLPTQNQDIEKTEQHTGVFQRALKSTLGKVGLFAGGTFAAAGLVFGAVEIGSAVTPGSEHHAVATAPADPTHTPEASSSATPSATPTPEATTTPETQPVPDISKYEAMSVEEFSALSSDEQMIFAAGKLIPNIKQFAVDYKSMTKNPNDVLPAVSSIDNTAQEINTQVAYNLRFAFTLEGTDREKFIIAVLRNNNQSGIYPIMEGFSANLPTNVIPKLLGYGDNISVGNATGMGDLKHDTNNDKFREGIAVTAKDGTSATYDAYFVEVPLPDGTTYKTWIRE